MTDTVTYTVNDQDIIGRASENKLQAEKMLDPTARFGIKIADIDMLATLVAEDDKNQIVADYFRIIGVKDPQ